MTARTCSIEGCQGRHYARGWCNPHYQRWQSKGDPVWSRPPRPTPTPEEVLTDMRAALARARAEVSR